MGSLRMLIRLLEASSPAQMSQQHEEACVPVVHRNTVVAHLVCLALVYLLAINARALIEEKVSLLARTERLQRLSYL